MFPVCDEMFEGFVRKTLLLIQPQSSINTMQQSEDEIDEACLHFELSSDGSGTHTHPSDTPNL